jgi:capsid portal protein
MSNIKSKRQHIGFIDNSGNFVRKSVQDSLRKEESTQLKDDLFRSSYGVLNVIQPQFSPSELALFMESNTYHSKCVRVKAEDGSGVSWDLNIVGEETPQSIYNKDFVSAVLNGVDINEVFNNMFVDKIGLGYGCIEIARRARLNDNPIDSIYHVPSLEVRVHLSLDKYVQMAYGKKVWFKRVGYAKDVHIETGEEFELGILPVEERANEMMFYKQYSPTDLVYGMTDLIPTLSTLIGDAHRQDFNINYFKTGGMPSWAVIITGDIDEEYKDSETGEIYSIQEEVQNLFTQVTETQASAVAYVLPSKGDVTVHFEKLGDEQKEISFREYRMDNRDEILSAHGVNAQRLGLGEVGNMGGSNTFELDEIYNSTVIEPMIISVEDFVNDIWIKSLGVDDVKFTLKRREINTLERKIANATSLFNLGALTPNKIIELFGEEFGLVKSDNDNMNGHYIGAVRIDGPLLVDETVVEKQLEVDKVSVVKSKEKWWKKFFK